MLSHKGLLCKRIASHHESLTNFSARVSLRVLRQTDGITAPWWCIFISWCVVRPIRGCLLGCQIQNQRLLVRNCQGYYATLALSIYGFPYAQSLAVHKSRLHSRRPRTLIKFCYLSWEKWHQRGKFSTWNSVLLSLRSLSVGCLSVMLPLWLRKNANLGDTTWEGVDPEGMGSWCQLILQIRKEEEDWLRRAERAGLSVVLRRARKEFACQRTSTPGKNSWKHSIFLHIQFNFDEKNYVMASTCWFQFNPGANWLA